MRRLLLLVSLCCSTLIASAQCTPAINSNNFYPTSTDVPCITPGTAFTQTYTITVPSTILSAPITSFTINSVSGLPAGITCSYPALPASCPGGARICFVVSGTTNDACGQYKMDINVTVSGTILGSPQTITNNLSTLAQQYSLSGFTPPPALRVYQAGINCPLVDPGQTAAFVAYTSCGTVTLPTLTTVTASSITTSSAVLNGTIIPNGSNVGVEFEWGTTVAYGNTAAASPSIANGSILVNVTATLSGLQPATDYHYRTKGTPSGGSPSYGNDKMLHTAGTTGVNDISVAGMSIYPNPVNGAFTLDMETVSAEVAELSMINSQGVECKRQQIITGQNTIRTDELPAGIYIVQVMSAKGVYTHRVIVYHW